MSPDRRLARHAYCDCQKINPIKQTFNHTLVLSSNPRLTITVIVDPESEIQRRVVAVMLQLEKISYPHKNGVCTLWLNLNRLSRLMPCGKRYFTFAVKPGTLQIAYSSSYHQLQASVAPTLHSKKNGRENTFFTERRHSSNPPWALQDPMKQGG